MVDERHFAEAFAWYVNLFTSEAWPEGSWQERYLSGLYAQRHDHPHVLGRAVDLAMRERTEEAIYALAGGKAAIEQDRRVGSYDAAWVDAGQDAIFLHHIDEGAVRDDHRGWLPSEMLAAGCAILGTKGAKLRAWAVDRARQLYRDGFYANPFSNAPRRRDAA